MRIITSHELKRSDQLGIFVVSSINQELDRLLL